MAPVLCFTAEEVWQEIEALGGRPRFGTTTVHAEVFPEPLGVPDDAPLLERWERLIAVREEVLKALEAARAEKRIGGSLEAKVTIRAPHDVTELLRSFGGDLRFLFLTSEVELEETPGESGPRITVDRARGEKCQRCWNYTTDVGADPEVPGACLRCAAAVREIQAPTGG
jgi:isoleucyl-tRNA synthetase